MPLLLGILRSAEAPEYRKLRAKAMECAGLIGMYSLHSFVYLGDDVFPELSRLEQTSFAPTPPSLWSCSYIFKVSTSTLRERDTTIFCIDSPPDPGDALLPSYLIATWAKVCQALGSEFEPYLPAIMPPLLRAASAKADVNVLGQYNMDSTQTSSYLRQITMIPTRLRTAGS
jgi:importin-5